MRIGSHWRRPGRFGLLPAGAVLVALFTHPVAGQAGTRDDIQALQIGQQEMQTRLNRLESGIQNQGLMEMAQMLERLQTQIRELRGQIEQQGHELEQLRKRQRDLYLDVDRRLSDLQLQGGAGTGIQSQSPEAAGDQNAADSTDNAEQQRAEYKSAFETLREGRYDEAIQTFSAFLKRYPGGGYADNAQYWLGEAHYVSRHFDRAVDEFTKVIEQYPQSTKVPDAKLKLGYTYYELQQWDKAREALSGILEVHPNTSVAPLAEKRLLRMSEEGH